jgi:hypothetical protein
MGAWFEFGKLVGVFLSGAGLIWVKEAVTAKLDRDRRREALWRACDFEVQGAYTDFNNAIELRDKIIRGRAVGGVFHAPMASAKMAEQLMQMDPANLPAYLPFVIRAQQHEQHSSSIKALFSKFADATDEQRHAQKGRLFTEAFLAARGMAWLFKDRLRILRVLRASRRDDAYAGRVIAEAEGLARDVEERCSEWEAMHASVQRPPS